VANVFFAFMPGAEQHNMLPKIGVFFFQTTILPTYTQEGFGHPTHLLPSQDFFPKMRRYQVS
jgi:hypothetical protein